MFKKVKTTVRNGRVEQETLGYFNQGSVMEDMARERRSLRQRGPEGRVSTIEHTMTTLVVLYVSGAVVVFNWDAEYE